MLTSKRPRSITLTSLAIFLLFGFPSMAMAQSIVSVPGTAKWIDTKVDVVEGDLLAIKATGVWTEGGTTNGPDGIEKPWPDNFFNIADLGACRYCAQTATPFQHALIGYIGPSPPAAGSYTSTTVFRQATKVFYVGSNYKAEAPASGRLWLNKNTDAYSNYTVDNGGQVQATIVVSPPETETQYHARMRNATDSVKELTPLQQARKYCGRAIADHIRNQVVKKLAKEALNELRVPVNVDQTYFTIMATEDWLKIFVEAESGHVMNATWDFGRFAYKVIGMFPGKEAKLFGLVGLPALDCAMAGFWYTGKLGGQIGGLLRNTLILPNADIVGDWILTRSASIVCINFERCSTAPIHIVINSCDATATQCTISRSDGDWQSAHTIRRSDATWSADFQDIGIDCNGKRNVAKIGVNFSVTTAEGGFTFSPKAKTLGGFYTVKAASNPPNCAGNASAVWLLFGSH